MELKVKRLTQSAKLPEVAHYGDLGYDVFTAEGTIFKPNELRLIDTGIALQGPTNVGFFVKDRSSIASKRGLVTHAGVIDAGYQGPIKILFHNITKDYVTVSKGEKIAQLVPIRIVSLELEEVVEFSCKTKRGDKGFGSTGK